MVYKPKTAKAASQAPSTSSKPVPSGTAPQKPAGPMAPPRLSAQSVQAVQARKQANNPNDPGVQAQARQLQQLIGQLSKQEQTTGSLATVAVGKENAANLRLGSSRRLVTDGGFWKGMSYASLDSGVKELQLALNKLRAGGNLPTVMQAYEKLYGTSLSAVLGERVRNPQVRSPLMATLPPPLDAAQLTKDAFIEQLAVQYVYQNTPAAALNASTNDGRRGSNPRDILRSFGYRAGPPIAGKWGFQMRVFLPLDPESGKQPIVAFRGTEGIAFSMKSEPEGTLDTIIGDFAPAGVGYNQYVQNHALIKRNMDAAASYGKVIITGHSLGGALAQIAATEFRGVATEVVTFQAAAISQQDVDKMKAHNAAHPQRAVKARHYRVDGDVVPNAGQANLPGEIHYFDRMVRPKGSTVPYKPELNFDTIDMTRAKGGHVSPILSTYLRGRQPHNAQQALLRGKGIKDESTLGKNGQDVQMVYSGRYSTQQDPRIQLESRRTTTMVSAMNLTNKYAEVYYDQISYNTLLAKVEGMAGGKDYSDYQSFRASAQEQIRKLSGKGSLPLLPQDRALGEQLKLKMTTTDYTQGPGIYNVSQKPSPFADMLKKGVPITQAAADRVTAELEGIWRSWHPEEKK